MSSLITPINVNICSSSGTIFSTPTGGGGTTPSDLMFSNLGATGAAVYAQTISNNVQFRKLIQGNNVSITQQSNGILFDVNDIAFNATTPVKRNIPGLVGINLNATSVLQTLQRLLYPTLPPTLSLSLSVTQFETGDSNPITANWGVTKTDETITSISVNGFSQIPTGNSQSGSLQVAKSGGSSVTVPMAASTATNSVATSAIAVNLSKLRIGPSTKDGLVNPLLDIDINGLSGIFATTYKLSPTAITIPINNYLVISIPNALLNGNTPVFNINGFVSNAFTLVRDNVFINSFGFGENTSIYVSNQFSTGNIQVEIS